MQQDNKVTIKKYPNRRLYNTFSSEYITLEEVSDLIMQGSDIEVIDTKNGKDITSSVLMQVLQEKHNMGYDLIPKEFLIHLIRIHNHPANTYFQEHLKSIAQYFQQSGFGQHFEKNTFEAYKHMQKQWQETQDKGLENMKKFFDAFLNKPGQK